MQILGFVFQVEGFDRHQPSLSVLSPGSDECRFEPLALSMNRFGSARKPNDSRVAQPVVERAAFDDLSELGMLLTPMVPRRTVVEQVRITGEWYGDYPAGKPVLDAYTELTKKVMR
jgi:hypothetical protein